MNNYTTIGNYFCGAGSVVSTLQNAPFSQTFQLKVAKTESGVGVYQTFKTLSTGNVAYRYYNGSTWSQYVYFSDDATIFVGTEIQSGDDLNDYTMPGIYRSTSSSITASLLNIPEIFSSGFAMLVFNMSLATNVQVIFAGDKIYMRFSNTGGWKSWFKYSGTIISS